MELRSIMDYAVHVTTCYMQLHITGEDSTLDYAAPETIYNYAVHGTTQYMGLRSTADYTVQVRKVHGTMPHRDSAIQCINDYAWISYPGQVNN